MWSLLPSSLIVALFKLSNYWNNFTEKQCLHFLSHPLRLGSHQQNQGEMTGHSQSSWMNPCVQQRSSASLTAEVSSPPSTGQEPSVEPAQNDLRGAVDPLSHCCHTETCGFAALTSVPTRTPSLCWAFHSITYVRPLRVNSEPRLLQSTLYRSSLSTTSIPCHKTANHFLEELLITCCRPQIFHVQLEDSLLNPYVLQLWWFGHRY